uniref:Uncharacterized protein n=3 Tax=Auxenochlorella protothecoides TaxID=3075 RepID=A0A1D2AC50_AUXPR
MSSCLHGALSGPHSSTRLSSSIRYGAMQQCRAPRAGAIPIMHSLHKPHRLARPLHAVGSDQPEDAAESTATERELLIEQMVRKKGPKKQAGSNETRSSSSQPASPQQAPPSAPASVIESVLLRLLVGIFTVAILEGLALAASGFLSSEVDSTISKYVYPAFTPTILAFLGVSTGYGLWKSNEINKA